MRLESLEEFYNLDRLDERDIEAELNYLSVRKGGVGNWGLGANEAGYELIFILKRERALNNKLKQLK